MSRYSRLSGSVFCCISRLYPSLPPSLCPSLPPSSLPYFHSSIPSFLMPSFHIHSFTLFFSLSHFVILFVLFCFFRYSCYVRFYFLSFTHSRAALDPLTHTGMSRSKARGVAVVVEVKSFVSRPLTFSWWSVPLWRTYTPPSVSLNTPSSLVWTCV